MGRIAGAQKTLIDLTDGYSVFLTNDNHTFDGTTDSVAGTQTTTSKIMAMRGNDHVPCTVGEMSTPDGISVISDGKTPEPTLTITATSALKTSGSFTIPVKIGDITINKVFSYAIAYKGQNGTSISIKSQSVTYQVSESGTTAPTGEWLNTMPIVPAGKYLWTKTEVIYSDNKKTTAYSVSRNGEDGKDGEGVTVKSTSITYKTSESGTVTPTGTWSTTPPTVPAGQYLWTKTEVTYSDNKKTISYSISRNGNDGSDAITVTVVSSEGDVFKNTAIATILTAHVFKGVKELSESEISAIGTIKWYKDGLDVSFATGTTLTISPGDVTDKGVYEAYLED